MTPSRALTNVLLSPQLRERLSSVESRPPAATASDTSQSSGEEVVSLERTLVARLDFAQESVSQ